ncbi:CHY zinc finger protein [Microbacterium phyllosphaerae]|uniref:CHY zinc finger protein n=1 Tax=Microbacterium phyllosphaerae TaxID=124798 RepID=UPI0032638161
MGHHPEVSTASTLRGRSADRPTRVGEITVHGLVVDGETRCEHYRGALDVIAIAFACCGDWYPCHLCHEEIAGHEARRWGRDERTTQAVLCGVCGSLLSIHAYLDAPGCPECSAGFNPGCRLHHHLYFD